MAADSNCPYCKRLTYMEYVDESARLVSKSEMRIEAAFQCAHCNRMSVGGRLRAGWVGTTDGAFQHLMVHEDSDPRQIIQLLDKNVEYWEPVAPIGKEYENLAPEIAAPANEAYQCLSVKAYRAAVLMARSVIEATAKSKGIEKGNLLSKIDKLADEGHIRHLVAQAAHVVRHIGNEMAHGDFATAEVTEADASDALVLMDEVLNEAFAVKNRLASLLARREVAREADASGEH